MISLIKEAESNVLKLKKEGNNAFIAGSKISENENGKELLMRACTVYGQAIEIILELESHFIDVDLEYHQYIEVLRDTFSSTRPTLFLNLAASNLKLGSADGALRCCSSAIQLCNNPGLLYSDMEPSEEDVDIVHPVAENIQPLITKALFRRAKCFEALKDIPRAIQDLQSAHYISPKDQEVKNALAATEKMLHRMSHQKSSKVGADSIGRSSESVSADSWISEESMTVNGGRCWMRRGFWSQTVTDAAVYIPVDVLKTHLTRTCTYSAYDPNEHQNILKNLNIEFKRKHVSISSALTGDKSTPELKLELELEYTIISSECTWTLDLPDSRPRKAQTLTASENVEDLGPNSVSPCISEGRGFLVLHLSKGPCFEWSPGLEWWDRVCLEDEPIDTTCCSIGADPTQLPPEARLRAERENSRFQGLTEEERAVEMSQLMKAKKDLHDSQLRTFAAAAQEEAAVRDVPERAAMLEAMRREFPHIDITAK